MKAFISYKEKGKDIEGIFELIENNQNFIKIKTNSNTLIIPYHKINKIKFKEMKGGCSKK